MASNGMSFLMTNWLMSVTVLVVCCLILINYFNGYPVVPRAVFEIFNTLNMLWITYSFLYFGQYFSQLRYLMYCALLMGKDMLRFAFLWLMFYLPSYFSFSYVLNRHHLNLCTEGYDSMIKAFYTNFRIILNLQEFNVSSESFVGYATAHMINIAINVFLLINLLIAVFSDSVSYVNRNYEALDLIQQLNFAIGNEVFVKFLSKFFFKTRQESYFIKQNDRLYLHARVLSSKYLTR
jgi:hypothetical protein